METKAIGRYIRISPQKVVEVIRLVKGMEANTAISTLVSIKRSSSPIISKIIKSALANRGKENKSPCYIKEIFVDGGPQMKRMRAASMGRGTTIRHRTSHITVVLNDKRTVK